MSTVPATISLSAYSTWTFRRHHLPITWKYIIWFSLIFITIPIAFCLWESNRYANRWVQKHEYTPSLCYFHCWNFEKHWLIDLIHAPRRMFISSDTLIRITIVTVTSTKCLANKVSHRGRRARWNLAITFFLLASLNTFCCFLNA